jgi:arabinofuranosyltransferase
MPLPDRRLRALLFLFYCWILLRNAWLCEDSYITFRVVDNFVHGLGLRWNPLERVQVYTHPLWMLCLTVPYFLTRDMYFSPVALSIVCSALTVFLILFRGIRATVPCLFAGVVLCFSKAFVDFSTSGLENPLSNLLLVLFFIEYLKPDEERRFDRMVWWAGLGITNRMDLMWFFLPALAHLTWAHGYLRRRHYRLWLGLLPFVAWELFSLVYYGFPFPSSAYAKLTTGVPGVTLVRQGMFYLINSLSWDPLTLFVIGALLLHAFTRSERDLPLRMLGIGVVLYLLYGLRVGGDYMTGRLLAAPFVVSVLVLSRIELDDKMEIGVAAAVVLALGFAAPRPPLMTNDAYVSLGSAPQSVDDEAGYRHETALLKVNKDHGVEGLGGWVADAHRARESKTRVSVYKNIGYYGFFAGPTVHVIDPYGLGDALMSRMPFTERMGPWSSGHFYRKVPEGYPDAAIDAGQIRDPDIDRYWQKIKLVSRGPIFARDRLVEVVRFNLGQNRPPAPPP